MPTEPRLDAPVRTMWFGAGLLGRHRMLVLINLVWVLGWWIRAWRMWQLDSVCEMVAGPFLACGPGPHAWQAPLLTAAVLPVGIGLLLLGRKLFGWRRGRATRPRHERRRGSSAEDVKADHAD